MVLNNRISTEFDGSNPVHRILDGSGKPSAMSVDDLKKEILANKELAPILKGSKASGTRGAQIPAGGRATNPDNATKPFDWTKATPEQMAARIAETKTNQE